MTRTGVGLLVLAFASVLVCAQDRAWPNIPVASKKDAEKLHKNRFAIEDAVTIDDKKWIRTTHDIEIAYPIKKDAIEALLLDFDTYTQFMPYLEELQVLSRGPGTLTARHKFVIRILSYAYITEYVQKYTWFTENGNLYMEWTLLSSNGTLKLADGGCAVNSVFANGEEYTRIRHRNDTLVRKDFGVQEAVMRMVGTSEVENILKTVYKEAKKRAK